MKKKFINFLSVLFLILLFNSYNLIGQVTFERTYLSFIPESGKDVLQTSDGGYIIAASTETSTVDDLDIMIVRTDNLGNILWKKAYGTNLPSSPNGILQTSDGNFFIVGYQVAAGSLDSDHYLLKIDGSNGDSLFSKVFGGYGNEESKEIIATSDGNYMIVGASNSISIPDNQMQVIKVDAAGNQLWTQYYGDLSYQSARSVKQCPDGGYILAGKTISAGMASIQLVKTNSTGGTMWTKTIGGTGSLEGKSILVNVDGSYTLSVDDSISLVNDSDVRIMKIDPTGTTIIWNNLYGGTEKDITKMLQPTSDGGYIVTALSRSFGWFNPDFWILKLDAMGDTMWTKNYGGSDHEHCYAVRQTSDSGYIVVGHSRSNPNGLRIEEMYLIKLNSNGELTTVGVNEYAFNNGLMVHPNPSSGVVNLNLTGKYESGSVCKIMNAMGQLVYSENIDSTVESSIIDLKNNAPGVYYVSIQSPNNLITKKLILN